MASGALGMVYGQWHTACYCLIQIVTVSTHSLWLLATYVIPYQFSVVPGEKSRMRLGSKPWLTSQRKEVGAGWRNIPWWCHAPGWNNCGVTRGKVLKAQTVLPISISYGLISFCQTLGGFIQSGDPALEDAVFVVIGDMVGEDYFHPSLAYLILLLWFIYLCLCARKPQMNSHSYKAEGLW